MYEMNRGLHFFFHPAKRREEKMYNKCVTTTLVSYVQGYRIFLSTADIRIQELPRCTATAFKKYGRNQNKAKQILFTLGELKNNTIREVSQGRQHTMELAESDSHRTSQFSD